MISIYSDNSQSQVALLPVCPAPTSMHWMNTIMRYTDSEVGCMRLTLCVCAPHAHEAGRSSESGSECSPDQADHNQNHNQCSESYTQHRIRGGIRPSPCLSALCWTICQGWVGLGTYCYTPPHRLQNEPYPVVL